MKTSLDKVIEGYDAFKNRQNFSPTPINPYHPESDEGLEWQAGYNKAQDEFFCNQES